VDIGLPGQAASTNVPILYLDQVHWISLAQYLWAPERLRDSAREAAEIYRSRTRSPSAHRIDLICAAGLDFRLGMGT
jgi:hypothetical protein